MKFKGKIDLQTTEPREIPGVKKVENDYFFAFIIEEVDGKPITSAKEFYDTINPHFPEVEAKNQKLEVQFQNQTFPKEVPQDKKVPHVTVGYYYNFRENSPENPRGKYGDATKGIDQNKVEKAQEYVNKHKNSPLEFEIPTEQLGLIVAATQPPEKSYINESVKLKNKGTLETAVGVGVNRDAVLVFTPPEEIQKDLREIAEGVFGKGVVPTQSDGVTPQPYHITVAQTNDFMKTLRPVIQQQAQQALEAASATNSNDAVGITPSMVPGGY